MWLKKYLTVFKLSWENVLEYRFNFLMGRVRSLVLLLTLYFLWTTVFANKANLFGFSRNQIVTYVLGATFLFSFVFVHSMDDIADTIANGRLSLFLLKPINFLGYWFVRRIASRLMQLLTTVAELAVFIILVRPQFFTQLNSEILLLSFVALLSAIVLLTFLDFFAGLASFWTVHAYGPRFVFKMLMEFTSGRFFPLNILPAVLFKLTSFLPFSFLVFFPLNVYLGRLTTYEVCQGLLTQTIWIAVLFVILKVIWSRGLRRYEAVGG